MNNIEHSRYTDTNRVKGVGFDRAYTPQEIIEGINSGFEIARGNETFLPNPLVQVRAIMHQAHEDELISRIEQRNDGTPFWAHTRLNGRIPFVSRGTQYGLYYATIESPGRGQFGNSVNEKMITHQEALNRARRALIIEKTPDITIQALNINDSTARNEDGERCSPLFDQERRDDLINGLIRTNLRSFAYSHDETQRQYMGVKSIIENNPILIAVPTARPTEIAAVGILERDERFSFDGIALIEPTYYTHPDFERRGLSARIRQLTNKLVTRHYFDRYYHSRGTLVFNESVRFSSFILSLLSGSRLGGDADAQVLNGDLGRAYTYIGPANPYTGYMPLGLSYYHNLHHYDGEGVVRC